MSMYSVGLSVRVGDAIPIRSGHKPFQQRQHKLDLIDLLEYMYDLEIDYNCRDTILYFKSDSSYPLSLLVLHIYPHEGFSHEFDPP
jgi:hypothetical protein